MFKFLSSKSYFSFIFGKSNGAQVWASIEKYDCCEDLEVCMNLIILGENKTMFFYVKAL